MTTLEADVVLVGYGPTGEVLANLLGARGWRVVAFDRAPDVFHQPRAAHFDAEIMRVLQAIDVVDAVAPAITPVKGMHFLNPAGQAILAFDAPDGTGPLGWSSGYMFYQPDLERALRSGAARYANVDVRLGAEVVGIERGSDTDPAVVSAQGPDGPVRVEARYVVGCDGARSGTRQVVGAVLDDFAFDQPWLVLDVILRRPQPLPEVVVQYCDPERPATFVPMPGDRRRFELMLMPGDTEESMLAPSRLAEMLAKYCDPAALEIERSAVYTFHGLLARSWRSGRVLLAGDAAHQMPPFLGQGMCAGVRDAANLAWKLDLVLRGAVGDDLLDTYQSERAPHVRTIIETAILLGGIIQTTDPEVAAQRDAGLLGGGGGGGVEPPMPAIGPGARDAGAEAGGPDAVGRPFPQPLLADGRRHDELLGAGFALVGVPAATDEERRVYAQAGLVELADPVPAVRSWLEAHGARGVIVRPDRIVARLTPA